VDVAFSEMGSLSLSGLAKAREVSTGHIWRHQIKKQQYARNSSYFFLSFFYTAGCNESCNGCFQLVVE